MPCRRLTDNAASSSVVARGRAAPGAGAGGAAAASPTHAYSYRTSIPAHHTVPTSSGTESFVRLCNPALIAGGVRCRSNEIAHTAPITAAPRVPHCPLTCPLGLGGPGWGYCLGGERWWGLRGVGESGRGRRACGARPSPPQVCLATCSHFGRFHSLCACSYSRGVCLLRAFGILTAG